MKEYVIGFMFYGGMVALVRKKRPAWQEGKLNGVGGKIEVGEEPLQAMEREFLEEAGLRVSWKKRGVVYFGPHAMAHVFSAEASEAEFVCGDEVVSLYPVGMVKFLNAVEDLDWMIPLCLSGNEHFIVEVKQSYTVKSDIKVEEWV